MKKNNSKYAVQSMAKHHRASEHELIPVHISKDEIIGFNVLQADEQNPTGQYVDPKSGLREYSRLSHLLKLPHIRKSFIELADAAKTGEGLTPEIAEQMETPLPDDMFIGIPTDNEKDIKEIEAAATIVDDEFIVMMPIDVVHFLSFLQGDSNPDPQFDLPQFGFGNIIKSIVRTAATVVGGAVGFAVGGPLGASAGAYVGNLAGRSVTGQPINKSFKAAMPNALYGGAAGLGMQAAGFGATAGKAAPIINGNTGAAMAPSAIPAAPTGSAFGNMFGAAQPYIMPVGLMGAGYLMGKKGDEQREKKEEQFADTHRKGLESGMNNYNAQSLTSPLYSYPEKEHDVYYGRSKNKKPYQSLNALVKEWETKSYNPHRAYKKGGMVKDLSTKGMALVGKGKGQEDLINKKIPEYTWINDAHTVSALGDGTTEEGQKELDKFEKIVKRNLLPKYKNHLKEDIKVRHGGKLREVDCAVANGERCIPPLIVGAIGEGSFEKGATILRKMTKQIRRHKSSKKEGLPPASLGLMTYYKKALGGDKNADLL